MEEHVTAAHVVVRPSSAPSTSASRARTVVDDRPKLVFVYDSTDGPSRRAERHLAHVLQRHRNHETFQVHRIDIVAQPELPRRLGVARTPAILVIQDRRIQAQVSASEGVAAIQQGLAAWLH